MSDFSEEEIQGKEGRKALAQALADGVNEKLMQLEDFGGIEEVHFTSFVLQWSFIRLICNVKSFTTLTGFDDGF